jgi:hypothetical protein
VLWVGSGIAALPRIAAEPLAPLALSIYLPIYLSGLLVAIEAIEAKERADASRI